MKLKKIVTLLGIISCLGILIFPLNIYAYDKQTYTFDTEGNYLVDNAANRTTDNQITLKVLVPKAAVLEGTFYYHFKCTSNNFSDSSNFAQLGYGGVAYKSRFDTCTELDGELVGTGKLVAFKFNIENGTYVFSTNDSTSIVTLTPELKNPMDVPINYSSIETAMASIKDYPVTLKNQSYILYAIYGDIDFVNENAAALANYAAGKKDKTGISTANDAQKISIADSLSDIAGNAKDSDLKELANELSKDTPQIAYPTSDIGKETPTSDGVTITTNTQTKEEEAKPSFSYDIKKIILIAVGLVIFFVVIKLVRRNKK